MSCIAINCEFKLRWHGNAWEVRQIDNNRHSDMPVRWHGWHVRCTGVSLLEGCVRGAAG